MTKSKPTLTVPEFATQLGVSRFTVSKWVQAGKVKGRKRGPFPGKTSPILIPVSELERLQKLMADEESAEYGRSSSS